LSLVKLNITKQIMITDHNNAEEIKSCMKSRTMK